MDKLLEYFNEDTMAADAWKNKYQMKNSDGVPVEETPTEMHLRLAREFGKVEKFYQERENFNKFDDLSDYGKTLISKRSTQTLDEIINDIYNYFKDFGKIVPQGSIMANLGNPYVFGSLSNCFGVEPPKDSYGGILRTDEELAQLMKRRGGVGTHLNNLRPDSALVSNTASSSTGVPSFSERYSNTTREVAQDGRRGALMLLLSCQHPDIFKYVTMKDNKTKVTGANVSVMLTNEFMECVKDSKDFLCRFPIDILNNAEKSTLQSFHNIPYNKLTPINGGLNGGYIMRIKSKELFDLIVEMAHKNAEPGVAYIDTILDYSPDAVYEMYTPELCNPCVSGDTEILTKDGYCEIQFAVDKEVEIWNGFEWSKVIPKITGYNQQMLTIKLSDGRQLTCTNYHKWILKNGERVEAINLKIGDKIAKYNLPYIDTNNIVNGKVAYTQGFISADGQDNYNHFWLYSTKFCCEDRLDIKYIGFSDSDRKQIYVNQEYEEKTFVPFKWNINAKLQWLAGLLDGDGTELIDGGCQLWSINLDFLKDVQKILTTLGVNSKVLSGKKEQLKQMPNGNGGMKEYNCQKSYRICIGATEIQELKELGLNCNRLQFNKTPNRSAQRFVYITGIEDAGYADKVYCFTDYKNNSGLFNGIMTANCGEQWFHAYDTCRLIALNLFNIVKNPFTNNSYIDFDLLYEISYIQQRLGDDLVDLEIKYIDRIIDKIKSDPEDEDIKQVELDLWYKIRYIAENGRRTGNGFTALGDMLAAININYSSNEAIAIVNKVLHTKMKAELDCTIDMSILRGSFYGYDYNKEFEIEKDFDNDRYTKIGKNSFFDMLLLEFPEQAERMILYGRRNVSWSTVAPTGTVSLMTQTSSGLEPLFKAYYIRKRKINPGEVGARVDSIDQNGDSWMHYNILHPKFKDWCEINRDKLGLNEFHNINDLSEQKIQYCFEQSPWYKSEADDIPWKARIDMNSVIQKYTSNALSCTINLPKDVSKETIANIYLEGWKSKLKGITVYRDGSRSGVLVTNESENNKDEFGYTSAIKRPKELEADYYITTSKGKKYAVIVGKLNNLPYELFVIEEPLNLKDSKGIITKLSKGRYEFKSENFTIENLQLSSEYSDEKLLTRWVSMLLRHRVNPKYVIEQVDKSEVSVVSFSKVISRILKKYIPNESTDEKCPQCEVGKIIYQEGCKKCDSCSYSKC